VSTFWTDLLFLHGYITDYKLARRLVNKPQVAMADKANEKDQAKITTVTSVRWYARLCLGIGDGAVHTQ
jgi:hypothetical protein